MVNELQITGKTLSGLEPVLTEELKALGAENIQPGLRAVSFTGNLEMLYKANLWCRAALRFLVKIDGFTARDTDELYENAKRFPWENYMGIDDTFAVDAVCIKSVINHTQYAALKVKDAIADRFREKLKRRPDVNTIAPDFKINVHISSDYCTLSLDSSGDSLHRRGYRTGRHEAPMSEVLAAGLLLLSGWDKKTWLHDPMCGSGTFLTEAALIATNTAPGLYRRGFTFQEWKDYDDQIFARLKQEAKEQIQPLTTKITGSDNSSVSMLLATENIESCGFESGIEVQRKSFESLPAPDEPCFIVMNPPYGERLKPDELNSLYAMIGTKLKKDYAGCQAWILSPNVEAMKHVGLKPSKKFTVFNGPLECKFVGYSMFKGSLKEHKGGENNA